MKFRRSANFLENGKQVEMDINNLIISAKGIDLRAEIPWTLDQVINNIKKKQFNVLPVTPGRENYIKKRIEKMLKRGWRLLNKEIKKCGQ